MKVHYMNDIKEMAKIKAPNVPMPEQNIPKYLQNISKEMFCGDFCISEDFINKKDFVYDMFGKKIYEGDYVVGPVASYTERKCADGGYCQEYKYCQNLIGKVTEVFTKTYEDNVPLVMVKFYYKAKKTNGESETFPLEKQGSDLIKLNIEHKLEEL